MGTDALCIYKVTVGPKKNISCLLWELKSNETLYKISPKLHAIILLMVPLDYVVTIIAKYKM